MLANKYRPKDFSDVVGQNVTTTILNNFIQNNILESMIFIGPAGCGKTSCARIFANKVNGDILEIDAARYNGVSEIKGIIEYAKTTSLTGHRKVIIIDEAHTLSSEAWSSLLITLEEGIQNAIFIFCTTNAKKIPDTIMSRLKVFNLMNISTEAIYERLTKVAQLEKLEIDNNVLQYIASISGNNLRKALSYLEKCLDYKKNITLQETYIVLNKISPAGIEKFFNFIHTDAIRACKYLKNIQNTGYDLYTFIEDCLQTKVSEALQGSGSLSDVNFCLQLLQELKYMVSNPGNIYNFICAKILLL